MYNATLVESNETHCIGTGIPQKMHLSFRDLVKRLNQQDKNIGVVFAVITDDKQPKINQFEGNGPKIVHTSFNPFWSCFFRRSRTSQGHTQNDGIQCLSLDSPSLVLLNKSFRAINIYLCMSL